MSREVKENDGVEIPGYRNDKDYFRSFCRRDKNFQSYFKSTNCACRRQQAVPFDRVKFIPFNQILVLIQSKRLRI